MKRKIDNYQSWHWSDSKGNQLQLFRKGKIVFEAKKFYEIIVEDELVKFIDFVRSIGHLTTVGFTRGIKAEIIKQGDSVKVKLSEWL